MLSKKQFDILVCMVENENISKEKLIEVSGYSLSNINSIVIKWL